MALLTSFTAINQGPLLSKFGLAFLRRLFKRCRRVDLAEECCAKLLVKNFLNLAVIFVRRRVGDTAFHLLREAFQQIVVLIRTRIVDE